MVYPCFYSVSGILYSDSASPSRVGNNLLTKLLCSLYCSRKKSTRAAHPTLPNARPTRSSVPKLCPNDLGPRIPLPPSRRSFLVRPAAAAQPRSQVGESARGPKSTRGTTAADCTRAMPALRRHPLPSGAQSPDLAPASPDPERRAGAHEAFLRPHLVARLGRHTVREQTVRPGAPRQERRRRRVLRHATAACSSPGLPGGPGRSSVRRAPRPSTAALAETAGAGRGSAGARALTIRTLAAFSS